MDSISVPILFALSDMSVMDMFAMSAAFAVSPPSPCSNDAANPVAVSMYSFADIPAVLYASDAYCFIVSALSLNRVSMPPMLCSRAAPSSMLSLIAVPIPAATRAFFSVPTRFPPMLFPADCPADAASPPSASVIFPLMPSADGIIWT